MNQRQRKYQQKKKKIAKEMKQAGPGVALGKKTSNLFRQAKQAQDKLDVSEFNHVLEIDRESLTVEVEGMITYENLVAELIKYGLVPTVAPELKSITIGGAFVGVGVESSSFKYGFVHETVLEADVLLSSGEVVNCSPIKNSDLFYAIPNSYGTLGYILRVKQKVQPAKKYVALERKQYNDYQTYVDDIKKYSVEARETNSYDYIDGLVFSKKEMYLMLGKFVSEAPFVSDYTYLDIYYKSMDKTKDYLTTYDYIFRYDTDWFWTTRAMGLENSWLRRFWGKKRLRSDVYYRLFGWGNKHKWLRLLRRLLGTPRTETLIQDAEVPHHLAVDFLQWFHQNITDSKPLTIGAVIPYSQTANFTMFPLDPAEVYMNIGYYSTVPSKKPLGYYNKLFEQKLMSIGAKKMMYSKSYYSSEEFWQIFDKSSYYQLKAKYDSLNKLPDLYEHATK